MSIKYTDVNEIEREQSVLAAVYVISTLTGLCPLQYFTKHKNQREHIFTSKFRKGGEYVCRGCSSKGDSRFKLRCWKEYLLLNAAVCTWTAVWVRNLKHVRRS